MASTSSAFNSPEARTALDSSSNNSPESLKSCFPPPPRFHLSQSGAVGVLWGNAMAPAATQQPLLKVPTWDCDNLFGHPSENATSNGQIAGHNVPPQQRSLGEVDRGLSMYATPTLTPRRSFTDLALELEKSLSLQPSRQNLRQNFAQKLDAYNSQVSLPLPHNEGSSIVPAPSFDLPTTPTGTRHLVITLPQGIEVTALKQFLRDIGDLKCFIPRKSGPEDVCIVSFFDTRPAATAHKRLRMEHGCSVKYCSPAYAASILGQHYQDPEGHVVCHVSVVGGPLTYTTPEIGGRLYKLMAEYGNIVTMTVMAEIPSPAFLVAYYDTRAADKAVAQLDSQYVEPFFIRMSMYEPGWNCLSSYSNTLRNGSTQDFQNEIRSTDDICSPCPRPYRLPLDRMVRPLSNSSLQRSAEYSPCEHREDAGLDNYLHDSRAQIPRGPQASLLPYRSNLAKPESGHQLARWQNDMDDFPEVLRLRSRDPRELRGPSQRGGTWGNCDQPNSRRLETYHHGTSKNIVDLDRIQQGLDTRTTVMLRNIPNKVDQQNLKEFIDSTSALKYNFLYLRIDFKNMCNVGYAFINFIDPIDIIPFVVEKSGQRWNKYNSDKVLDVTYANIQGIDQLVEKFRNSSVMDQPEAYRPKLYYSTGPNIGQEMTFPESNNPNRKLRSVTAAQHIGLFAPKINSNGKVWRKRD